MRPGGAGGVRHPFDHRHGVETSGLIYGGRLAAGRMHEHLGAGYYATAPSLFRGAIERWSATLPAVGCGVGEYSFIDIGCGKGRALMLASEYGFDEIIGIELSLELVEVARRNLARWLRFPRACGHVRILHGDALSLPIAEGPAVLFFFNSFEREMTGLLLERLARIAAHRSAPLDLIYIHPEHDELVRQLPGVEVLIHEEITFSAEDAAADAFGVQADGCAVYRWRAGQTD